MATDVTPWVHGNRLSEGNLGVDQPVREPSGALPTIFLGMTHPEWGPDPGMETPLSTLSIDAGTVVGPHHRDRETGNQDALAHLQENGHTVLAVADGAGSLAKSDIGAAVASSTAVEETMDALNGGVPLMEALTRGMEEARRVLLERDDRNEIGCTLALAAVSGSTWGVAVVGDAFAVVSLAEDHHVLVRPERQSEFANITPLITSRTFEPLYHHGEEGEDIVAISLASDGLENVSLESSGPSAGFWNPIVTRALNGGMDVGAFLQFMGDHDKLVDDTTLAIAHR